MAGAVRKIGNLFGLYLLDYYDETVTIGVLQDRHFRRIAMRPYNPGPRRIYADRIAGRDRDHRGLDWAVTARRAKSARSRRSHKCLNNLKQIGLALHNYESAALAYPPGGIYPPGVVSNDVYWIQCGSCRTSSRAVSTRRLI